MTRRIAGRLVRERRLFGGRQFRLVGPRPTKAAAKASARKWRDGGFNARVVKVGKSWMVYTRMK